MATHQKNDELFLAISKNDEEKVSSLIGLHGKNLLNSQDELGSSALHLAVMNGHLDMAKLLLLQKDINPNLQAYKHPQQNNTFSPLDIAIKYNQPVEMIALLLQNGATTAYPTDLLMMLIDNAFTPDGMTFKQETIDILNLLVQKIPSIAYIEGKPLSSILSQLGSYVDKPEAKVSIQKVIDILIEQDLKNYAEKFILAKNFTHAFPSANVYSTINIYSKDSVHAEGHFTVFTVKSFFDSHSDYLRILHEQGGEKVNIANYGELKKNVFSELNTTFYVAHKALQNAGLYDVSELLYSLYNEGHTLLLPTGWHRHAIDIILDKSLGLYIVANAGDRYQKLPSGIKAYENHSPISTDDIYKIINNQNQFNLEYEQYYELVLQKNNAFSQSFPNQDYGNCALNSLLLANWSLTYINIYKQTNDPVLSKQLTDLWHQDIVEHHKTLSLKNYLSDPYFKDDKPLYDALVKYEVKLDHPEKFEQSRLILSYLTSPEHIAGFKHFYKKHQTDFSSDLKQFIQQSGYTKPILMNDVLASDSVIKANALKQIINLTELNIAQNYEQASSYIEYF